MKFKIKPDCRKNNYKQVAFIQRKGEQAKMLYGLKISTKTVQTGNIYTINVFLI